MRHESYLRSGFKYPQQGAAMCPGGLNRGWSHIALSLSPASLICAPHPAAVLSFLPLCAEIARLNPYLDLVCVGVWLPGRRKMNLSYETLPIMLLGHWVWKDVMPFGEKLSKGTSVKEIQPVQTKCKYTWLHQLSENTLFKQIKKLISSYLKGLLADTCKWVFDRKKLWLCSLSFQGVLRWIFRATLIFNVMDRIPKA